MRRKLITFFLRSTHYSNPRDCKAELLRHWSSHFSDVVLLPHFSNYQEGEEDTSCNRAQVCFKCLQKLIWFEMTSLRWAAIFVCLSVHYVIHHWVSLSGIVNYPEENNIRGLNGTRSCGRPDTAVLYDYTTCWLSACQVSPDSDEWL